MIVRRVKDLNPDHQGDLFTAYRYHAVLTDTPAGDAGRQECAPRPRDRRAGHRRPQERAAGALPLVDFDQNRIWCVIIALASEISAWLQMLARTGRWRGLLFAAITWLRPLPRPAG